MGSRLVLRIFYGADWCFLGTAHLPTAEYMYMYNLARSLRLLCWTAGVCCCPPPDPPYLNRCNSKLIWLIKDPWSPCHLMSRNMQLVICCSHTRIYGTSMSKSTWQCRGGKSVDTCNTHVTHTRVTVSRWVMSNTPCTAVQCCSRCGTSFRLVSTSSSILFLQHMLHG